MAKKKVQKKARTRAITVVKPEAGDMTQAAMKQGPFAFAQALAQAIAEPTPKEYLRTKPGRGNLTYVEVGYIRRQLTKTFGMSWSFETEPMMTYKEAMEAMHIIVKGTLTIINPQDGSVLIQREQYGGQPIHRNVDLGDMWKGAASDALKKCASLLGIAQDIYEMKTEETEQEVKKKEMTVPEVVDAIGGTVVNSDDEAIMPKLHKACHPDSYGSDQRIDLKAVAIIAKLFNDNGLAKAGKEFMKEHFGTTLTSTLKGAQYKILMAWILDQDPENPPF